jgi:predicted nucleic acid-binding protein
MKLKIYIDTSVIGSYFDKEFEEATKMFFAKAFESNSRLLVSNLLEFELISAPQFIRDFFESLPKDKIVKIESSEEAQNLAQMYIDEKIVGKTSMLDCQHIATATLNNADVLVSWNFKHIVNLMRIKGYNSINLREGFHTLEIRTPKEIFTDENE